MNDNTRRRIGLSCLAISLAACNTEVYTVHTCSFGSGETGCSPILSSSEPSNVIDVAFMLVNPNLPSACAGDFHLGVNTPKNGSLSWHAQEKDSATCAPVGSELSGEAPLHAGQNDFDTHFPQGDFTFRVSVRPGDR